MVLLFQSMLYCQRDCFTLISPMQDPSQKALQSRMDPPYKRSLYDSSVLLFNLSHHSGADELGVATCSYRMKQTRMGYGAAVIGQSILGTTLCSSVCEPHLIIWKEVAHCMHCLISRPLGFRLMDGEFESSQGHNVSPRYSYFVWPTLTRHHMCKTKLKKAYFILITNMDETISSHCWRTWSGMK